MTGSLARGVGPVLVCVATSGCGALLSPPSAPVMTAPADPTPLARCRVAASTMSPLVTEWPASQKAYLEGLTARQAVAVAYSGCELRIVDACRLTGRYVFRRTTPATDTLEISSADDLWAKLPIGAAGLEGELARTGRLAVRTTIAGQLELEGVDGAPTPADAACTDATHVITAASVGAFRLLSGAGGSAKAIATGFGAGAGGGASREESVVREAGDPASCSSDGAQAPINCASPIQLFLQPLRRSDAQATGVGGPPGVPAQATASTLPGVEIAFPEQGSEHWALHDANGTVVCDVPCTRSVPAGSGWYLERTGAGGLTHIDLPARLPYAAGTRTVADYRGERGNPLLSTLTFWGLGVPAAVGGAVTVAFGIAGVGNDNNVDLRGFWIGSGIMFLAVAGAATWWYLWSHPSSFDTHEAQGAPASLSVGPGGVGGSF
jgi:hypothetical protein